MPSLALAVYTSSFYDESAHKIKMIKGTVEQDLRDSYFGGNVGVYINKITNGYLYDMNSQYPYAMLNDMPVGNPVFFEGNILDFEKDPQKRPFGIFNVEIEAPKDLKMPLLQLRCKTKNGTKTIAPVGT